MIQSQLEELLETTVLHDWRLSSRTWNPITSPWMKQLTWLRIVHSGDWCLWQECHTLLVVRATN